MNKEIGELEPKRLLVRAPVRISLFGGGTDIPSYSDKNGGVCVNMAINLYQQVTLSDDLRIYSFIEDDDPRFFYTFFDNLGYKFQGIKHTFDNSIHSGLGSSASLGVALVAGSSKLLGKDLTKYEIAEKAWDIEVNKLGLFGGRQDQFACSLGGFNLMKFGDQVEVQPFSRRVSENIASNILLFDSGIRRTDSTIQEGLKVMTPEKEDSLDKIKGIANDSYHSIYGGDIEGLGRLLDASWQYKKLSNKVSTPEVDQIYDKAISLGAYGGKLCGSGGGGYMIFIADKSKHKDLKNKLGLKWIDYSIDFNGVSTRYL